MKKVTTITYTYDENSKMNGKVITEQYDYDDGIIGVCDGDCEDCEDPTLCENTIDVSPTLESAIEFNPTDVINRVLAMIALGFSAATAIKLWKKVR